MKFVFITDLHVSGVSNVRLGDYLQDVCDKLDYVVNYCNANDATLLIGGDVFDKAIVADSVKSAVASCLAKAYNKPISIMGNHDRIFESDEQTYKTSYNVLATCGCVSDISNSSLRLPSNLLITNLADDMGTDTPTIGLFHGFLNQEDGRNTFRSSCIGNANGIVLLGHDHSVHKDLKVNNMVIVRPGSFSRIDRTEESMRTPNMVVIEFDEVSQTIKHEYVPIAVAKDSEDIFKTKIDHAKTTNGLSYMGLLLSLNNKKENDDDLITLLGNCASYKVVGYVQEILSNKLTKK